MKRQFLISSALIFLLIFIIQFLWFPIIWSLVIMIPLFLIGLSDMLQKKYAIRGNFPLIGNFRYLLESIGPEINQYFIESSSSGVPFSRESRSLVEQLLKQRIHHLPQKRSPYDCIPNLLLIEWPYFDSTLKCEKLYLHFGLLI